MPACGTARSVAEIRLMTHFASADEPQDPATRHQIGRFAEAAQRLGLARSFCNSAGVLGWPEAHAEWIRPGVMLYGISPLPGRTGPEEGLSPVMTLTTALIAVREVQAGEAVGYGAAWRATMPSRIGIAALGYADGYPRHAPSGTPVLVNGRPSVTVGRVSMDMLAVDLGDQPEAACRRPGHPVGGGPACRAGRGLGRHHRLRAGLRPRRPRPCRAARRPLSDRASL